MLEALFRAGNVVASAETALKAHAGPAASREAMWTPVAIAHFSQLVFQHQKNFAAVAKDMKLQTAEVMGEFWRGGEMTPRGGYPCPPTRRVLLRAVQGDKAVRDAQVRDV